MRRRAPAVLLFVLALASPGWCQPPSCEGICQSHFHACLASVDYTFRDCSGGPCAAELETAYAGSGQALSGCRLTCRLTGQPPSPPIDCPVSLAGGEERAGEPLKLVAFNVESGGADVATLRQQLAAYEGVDLWVLSEVDPSWPNELVAGAATGEEETFASVVGTSGREDRLMIVYNDDRLDLVGLQELHRMNPEGRVRSPLAVRFRDTANLQEILVVANHLYRSRAEARHRQAADLAAWAREQDVPVVMAGDFNFDWNVAGGEAGHDRGYDNLTADGACRWLRPEALVKTQCSERFNSVLDFVFFCGPQAEGWSGTSEIGFAEPAYCENANDPQAGRLQSDHRPVEAAIQPGEVDCEAICRRKARDCALRLFDPDPARLEGLAGYPFECLAACREGEPFPGCPPGGE